MYVCITIIIEVSFKYLFSTRLWIYVMELTICVLIRLNDVCKFLMCLIYRYCFGIFIHMGLFAIRLVTMKIYNNKIQEKIVNLRKEVGIIIESKEQA